MRIAIFQADYPLISSTRDLVNGLVSLGCSVDLVLANNCDRGFIDTASIAGRITTLGYPGLFRSHYQKVIRLLSRHLSRHLMLSLDINSRFVRDAVVQFCKISEPFDVFIGIEKSGLELATICSESFHVPVIYYSAELYYGEKGTYSYAWQRSSEALCHRKAVGTIVQDKYRWQSLRAANHVANDNVFFLPIGARVKWHDKIYGNYIEGKLAIVLYFGTIHKNRFTDELIKKAYLLPKGVILRLHGPSHIKTLTKQQGVNLLPSNIIFTCESLSESALDELVASATIGLALYRQDNDNDRLTAYSSQKIAFYLRSGLPIICFRSETYEDLFSNFKCGVMIESINEIGNAVSQILDNYSMYSYNAKCAFKEIYNLDLYWTPLNDFLQQSRLRYLHHKYSSNSHLLDGLI